MLRWVLLGVLLLAATAAEARPHRANPSRVGTYHSALRSMGPPMHRTRSVLRPHPLMRGH